jgi:XTP/dITP diphosphohydrolase
MVFIRLRQNTMRKLIFATQNKNKALEINQLLQKEALGFEVIDATTFGITEDIPETGETLIDNALQKARYVYEKWGVDCFADDTGLEIAALNGEPGVYSARYAGEERDSIKNMELVLEKLKDKSTRTAKFKTVIALILDGKEYLFEGEAEGQITEALSGKAGFGYDPIFMPDGYEITFAEMDAALKNSMSHRGRAVRKLIAYIVALAS